MTQFEGRTKIAGDGIMSPSFERSSMNSFEPLAVDTRELTSSALNDSVLKDEDLSQLLNFVREVNNVLIMAIEPTQRALEDVQSVDLVDNAAKRTALVAHLEELQTREYYKILTVCDQLRTLNTKADTFIRPIVDHLKDSVKWRSLFDRIDEREGYIQHLVSQEIRELTSSLKAADTPQAMEAVKKTASALHNEISMTLEEMRKLKDLLMTQSGTAGFRSLTSRKELSQKVVSITHVHHNEKIDISRARITNGSINVNTGQQENITAAAGGSKMTEKYLAYIFGTVFLAGLLALVTINPKLTPTQWFVYRIVLAIAAAGVAAVIPGFLTVRVPKYIRAGGALAIFIIVFWFNPPTLSSDFSGQDNTSSTANPSGKK
ncbi:MAG: hypothetical protein ACJ746_14525 [Bryobacteraceae bacterium]